jgi:hypothetical protein
VNVLNIKGIVYEMEQLLIKDTLIKRKRTTDNGCGKKGYLSKIINYTTVGRPSPSSLNSSSLCA